MIIDFHIHTFPEKIAARVVEKLGKQSHTKYFTDGSGKQLIESAKRAGITYSVNLPVMTRVDQVEKVNTSLIQTREELFNQGIITFGGIHPDYENYRAELKRLKDNGFKGIKLHPAYQELDLDDIRYLRIIDCASEMGFITLIHAGIDIGYPGHNYASVKQVLSVISQVHPEKFVLAHMGGWGDWENVEEYLAGAPVWLDTAFSIGPVTPGDTTDGQPYLSYNLTDEAFVRLVRKHGADRVLFGTDSPWEDQSDYLKRIRKMELTEEEKRKILSDNGVKLLGL